ncbi:hypothetical protein N1027_05890 [Herbiconiux sp. CPCC 205763]|uniref:Uncharacterized protein n=1 Tax=Herbiconiux aconitum TaxID=2970913 RepID=A0ABT2GN59_9MICO|nr:hypothetical protein [Herbiconiux aconitum]MCS5717665.1 hypothetical protein [Herbiconiux aconitum]
MALAVVCLVGSVVLGGRVALELYSDLRTNLQVVCAEQALPQGADTNMSALANIDAGIGPIPLGVWCSFPAVDGGKIVVPPSLLLTGITLASLFLLTLGVFAAAIARRMKPSHSI